MAKYCISDKRWAVSRSVSSNLNFFANLNVNLVRRKWKLGIFGRGADSSRTIKRQGNSTTKITPCKEFVSFPRGQHPS